jgi:hypothetical protein
MPHYELPRLTISQESPSDYLATADDPAWEPRLDHQGLVCAYTRLTAGSGWLYIPGLAGYRFTNGAKTVEACPEPGASSDLIVEAYQRLALPMALQAGNHEVLHASAVRTGAGVHVFCGASRAGKSTLAYALSRRGLEVWADDAVAFSVIRGAVIAVSLPFALRLRGDVAKRYDASGRAGGPSDKIETLRLQGDKSAPIASVWILEREPASSIMQLPPSEALPAVLYHSFYFSLKKPAVRRRMAAQFLDLVAQVPVYRLSYAGELDQPETLLDELHTRLVSVGRVASA